MIKVFERNERTQFLATMQDPEEKNDLLFTGTVDMRAVTDAVRANTGKHQIYVADDYIFAERTPSGEISTAHFIDTAIWRIVARKMLEKKETDATLKPRQTKSADSGYEVEMRYENGERIY